MTPLTMLEIPSVAANGFAPDARHQEPGAQANRDAEDHAQDRDRDREVGTGGGLDDADKPATAPTEKSIQPVRMTSV
jgi:hypothetical protein